MRFYWHFIWLWSDYYTPGHELQVQRPETASMFAHLNEWQVRLKTFFCKKKEKFEFIINYKCSHLPRLKITTFWTNWLSSGTNNVHTVTHNNICSLAFIRQNSIIEMGNSGCSCYYSDNQIKDLRDSLCHPLFYVHAIFAVLNEYCQNLPDDVNLKTKIS